MFISETIKKENNFIKLARCAYLFDSYKDRIYFNHERYERHCVINKFLENFYYNDEARQEWIPCIISTNTHPDGSLGYRTEILINNKLHGLNALQIAEYKYTDSLPEPLKVVNNKAVINTINDYKSDTVNPQFTNTLYFDCLKSLALENFTNPGDLGYLRLHFKNNCVKFIIDKKGSFYYADCLCYVKTTIKKIVEETNATSQQSVQIITDLLKWLKNKAKKEY